MRKIILFSIFIFFINEILFAQLDNSKFNSMGKYFLVALTPNDNPNLQLNNNSFVITGNENTEIVITNPKGQVFKIPYQKNRVLKIDGEFYPGLIVPNDENWESEVIQKKNYKITSEKDINLQVVMKKGFSSDSYLAMPVGTWGNHYIHNSYWDLKETGQWAGGFVIIASENDTKVTIAYKGKGTTFGSTNEGKKIGDTEIITMNKGQTYMVMGDAQTRGIFDLSGTDIKSNKPIGVISFHNRTLIPSSEVQLGRNHLVEFILPTNLWGKNFTTMELNRETPKGDYFRVIALEENTTLEISTYNINSKEILSQETRNLEKNKFYEFDSIIAKMPHNNVSKSHINTWKSDKPILLMQYAYSSDFDGNENYKPFMTIVPPTELFTKEANFTTAYNETNGFEYEENYLHLTIIGSEYVNENQRLLETVFLNDTKLTELIGAKYFHKIPNSNLNIVRIPLTQGQYKINGEASFGGLLYGLGKDLTTYAYPAVMSLGESRLVNSVENAEKSNDIIISPNPASDEININLDTVVNITSYKIIDKLGNTISLDESNETYVNINNSEFQINTKSLSSGVYYIIFNTIDGKKLYNSFIINK